jgi:Ca2+-transporting ATPase
VLKQSPLKTIQLLWVNLIMDSLGALALATRGPSDALLNRPPYGEADNLISNVLLRNIIGHVLYQLIVLMIILFGAKHIFGISGDEGDQPHYISDILAADQSYKTVDLNSSKATEIVDKVVARYTSTFVFNAFVYMQVFNLINARVAGQDFSVLDGLFSNPYFLIIFVCIAGVQAILSELAGVAFETYHMEIEHWVISLAFGAGALIIGALLRFITLADHTTERLNALRRLRVDAIKSFYAEVPGPRQWEMNSLADDAPSGDEEAARP